MTDGTHVQGDLVAEGFEFADVLSLGGSVHGRWTRPTIAIIGAGYSGVMAGR
jgi:hypothetical protein